MDDVKYEYGCEITSTKECPLRKEIRAEVLLELFCLAKEFSYDDGVDYSISLQDLDNIITELKGYK